MGEHTIPAKSATTIYYALAEVTVANKATTTTLYTTVNNDSTMTVNSTKTFWLMTYKQNVSIQRCPRLNDDDTVKQ